VNAGRRLQFYSGAIAMSTAENKRLVQKIFAGLAEGNPQTLVDYMDDGFRWTISGDSQWSKIYNGKHTVLKELFGLLGSKFATSPRLIASRFIAEDDLVVVEARGNFLTRTGAPYRNSYCYIVRIAGGKVQEITEYMDTELATRTVGPP
jgi:ketosteroid isomerase-like protein